ncbi:MAG: BON domain-containing protein [Chloroflexota bacterium]
MNNGNGQATAYPPAPGYQLGAAAPSGFGPSFTGGPIGNLLNAYGGYLPRFDQGFGPGFGGGFGSYGFAGQVGQGFTQGNAPWLEFQPTDQQIESLLYDALDNSGIPSGADIDASVKNGTVTLAGTTRNKHVKLAADRIAWALPGVQDVNNTIQVQSRNQQAQQKGQQTK